MKNYASAFGAVLQKRLPELPAGNTLAPPSLPLHSAANFQRAVAKEKRSQERSDASQALAGATEPGLEELLALQRRNEERENEGCICVPLEDVLRGPGHGHASDTKLV